MINTTNTSARQHKQTSLALWSRWPVLLGLIAVLLMGLPNALLAQQPANAVTAAPTTESTIEQQTFGSERFITAKPGQKVLTEHWYVVQMADQPTGWLHAIDVQDTKADRRYSNTHMFMTIRRGEFAMSIETRSKFTETLDGKPIQAVSMQKISKMATVTTMDFEPGQVVVTTVQGQRTNKQTVPASHQAWMTPGRMSDYIEEQLKAGKKTMTAWSIEPSLGPDPFETTLNVTGHENVEVLGKVVPATVIQSTSSRMPGVTSTLYANEKGEPVRMNMNMGAVNLKVVEADRSLALSPIDPPQLLADMLITPTTPIHQPRTLRQAIYELRIGSKPAAKGANHRASKASVAKASGVKLPETFLPAGGYQRVVWGNQSTVRVVVDLDEPVPPGTDLPTANDRDASPMLDTNDPKVKQLALQALQGVKADADDATKAEAIRRFVYHFIDEKDLSVGFASASEVARTSQGDCTEHAVLLAALLRVAGIPSRTVSGVVYVDEFEGHKGVFGYHMWTRGWLETGKDHAGRWVDLDATLDPVHAFDATHIALGVSSMSQGVMTNDMLVLAPIMGRLEITPIKTGK